ncbi:hypothetical protein PLICRDRAFT_98453 [Plicaturopsis crispa FD-325 SS-3]|nr:hypothetical protein PLICRDRAFT_98453 [Plicaturopsis crispa FD-325 SS-3]
MSLGNIDSIISAAPSSFPRSFAPEPALHRRTGSSHALIDNIPTARPLHTVPFPQGSDRSISPGPRPHSRADSLGSRRLLDDARENPFAVRPPSPERASRFDPKAARGRTLSNATHLLADEHDNPFAVRPPSPSRSSRFDPKLAARARTASIGSMGSRMMLDNDRASVYTGAGMTPRERPYSTMDLLRPKILVMPSPLQSTQPKMPPPEPSVSRQGFHLSTDGPPLPSAARTSRRASGLIEQLQPEVPIASNSFTPNPRMSLSLSQLTFRNSLMVGGQRDVAYDDIDRELQRATEDGMQIRIEDEDDNKGEGPSPRMSVYADGLPPKAPGKLYGKSLIDDLEARKAAMRNKQRVFRGDDRPSMMARTQLKRSSTLIDPSELQARPVSQHMISSSSQGSPNTDLNRRSSAMKGPLITFGDGSAGPKLSPTLPSSPGVGMSKTRSVFGVDTLWEREMVKLKEIEAQERLEAEEREREEALREAREKHKKKKGKSKSKAKETAEQPIEDAEEPLDLEPSRPILESRVSAEPPRLPALPKTPVKTGPPPINGDDESESDSDSSSVHARPGVGQKGTENNNWFAGSSDEEDNGPRRVPGTGPRYPNKSAGARSRPADDSSDEDVPLAAAIERVALKASQYGSPAGDDSDEDRPLTALLDKTKLKLPSMNFGSLSPSTSRNDEDEDDQPLGLRASMAMSPGAPSFHGNPDEDDRPLALHPEQQRRTQYQMMAQHQQMMMQAQMQNSMYFGNPSMMSSGFFAPPPMVSPVPPQMPMMMPMGQPPAIPSPPPISDPMKYGRVDRWRHDVAVEGEP